MSRTLKATQLQFYLAIRLVLIFKFKKWPLQGINKFKSLLFYRKAYQRVRLVTRIFPLITWIPEMFTMPPFWTFIVLHTRVESSSPIGLYRPWHFDRGIHQHKGLKGSKSLFSGIPVIRGTIWHITYENRIKFNFDRILKGRVTFIHFVQ